MIGKHIVIVIPAHNEENWIRNTIEIIRSAGVRSTIVVVDDGSADRTAQIAERLGAIVLRMGKNVGKGHAFLRGVKYALAAGARGMVAMDADTVRIPRSTMKRLIHGALLGTRRGEMRMIIANQHTEAQDFVPIELSGCRSFSLPAMLFLARARGKKLAKGYGLEMYLNSIFDGHTTRLGTEWVETRRTAFEIRRKESIKKDLRRMARSGIRYLRGKMNRRKK